MSLTAFVVVVGTPPACETIDAAGACLDDFLTKLAEQPTHAHSLPGARLWQSSIYPDESEVAVFRHRERHPQDGREHDRMIVFDGWIENRDEIVASLQHHGITEASSDSEIVLAGYREWGYDVAHQLYGEYSFVVLDHENGQPTPLTFAVRDKVGIRPLFYSQWKGGVAISNFPGALSVIPWVGSEINEGYAAEFLCGEVNSFRETFYTRVNRVIGGEWLSCSDSVRVVATNRYWNPTASPCRLSEADAKSRLLSLFVSGARAASRSNFPLALRLSGGVDSSCVALALAQSVKAGGLDSSRLTCFSLVYPGLDCDEGTYIDSLAGSLPFESVRLIPTYATAAQLVHATRRLRYVSFSYAGTSLRVIEEQLRRLGGRVALDGEGGDELLAPTAAAVLGALRCPAGWRAVARLVLLRWRRAPTNWSALGRLRWALESMMPARARNFLSKHYDRRRREWVPVVDRSWSERVKLHSRIDRILPTVIARTRAAALATTGFWSDLLEHSFSAAFISGIERRSPLLSGRLIEYCNSLPLFLLDGQWTHNRWLLREAFSSELPPMIRDRENKAEFTASVLPALLRVAETRFGVGWRDPSFGARGGVQVDPAAKSNIWAIDRAQSFHVFHGVITDAATARIDELLRRRSEVSQ
jgi:asparagine synthase (glutamine-hydrolysing)